MKESIVERVNPVALFKKEFFESVKIESRTKGTGIYHIIHKNGRRELPSARDLFNQSETRFILLRLTDRVMPNMSRSEYIGFVQDMMKNTSVSEE